MEVQGSAHPTAQPPLEPVRFRGTLATRVAMLTALAVATSVVLGSVAAYVVVRHQLYAALDASLVERAEAAAASPALTALTRENIPSWALGAADIRIGVLDDNGNVTQAGEGQSTIKLERTELAVAQGSAPSSTRTAEAGSDRYRVAAVPGNQEGTALILAQSLDPTYDALGKFSAVLTLFGLLGIALAGLLGWQVARNGLRPVRELAESVEDIARTEDLSPLPVRGDDEVARLSTAFNQVLAALDRSRTRQSQLVADAGHELRTPLTSLRTNLDLLRQADDPGRPGSLGQGERTELMEDLRFQTDELTQLIGDLTELARQDAPEVQRELVDLTDVVERSVERVRRRASSLRFDVRTDPWWVYGDPTALERAVTNLLDNAAKWSPPQGRVAVTLGDGVVSVVDEGPGIPPADLPHVFERFYRSVDSRTMPGSGLGLAIVAKVAESHHGWVRAGSAPGGGAALSLAVPGTAAREQLSPRSHTPLSHDSATGSTVEP